MSLEDDAKEIINSAQTPLQALEESHSLLKAACSPGGPADPLGDRAADGHSAYMAVANELERRGFLAASESLLVDWWNYFGERQRSERKRVYRAVIAFKLTELNLRVGDIGSAIRWALHTQADDILGENPARGGAGKQQLRTIFGMSSAALKTMNGIADECRENINRHLDGDWSNYQGFAEEVVRRFVANETTGSFFLADPSLRNEFPLSRPYFSSLIDYLNSATGSKSKGDALEDLTFYLFLLLPGCIPRRNLIDEQVAFETDIVVRNLSHSSNVVSELLGRHFLVECKNWDKPVGVRDVGYFLYRMRLTHSRFGVIFSREGITGEDQERAASSLIRRAFHEDGSICIVINISDIEGLLQEQSSFWWLMLEKAEQFRFGNQRILDR